MKKEFNLSDYIYPLTDKRNVLPESKVKEFIKIILENPTAKFIDKDEDECISWKIKDLKKRAGNKLV